MTMTSSTESLCDVSAVQLAQRLRRRELCAVEVLEAYVARIEQIEEEIGAFVTLDLETAMAQARACDEQASRSEFNGPLHGVPVAIKDIFQTAGLRTTFGSRAFADHVPDVDAVHVARIRHAGGIVLGKTNTPEFAFSGQTANLVAGTTRNPHDPTRTVAGSSGGSAAALAAGMAALCDGSDLGGSLRSPAAWCGVVGFRPTSGLVPFAPNPMPFDGLHTPGPMGRTVEDVALLLEVMAGPSPQTALISPASGFLSDGLEDLPDGLCIAWCMTPAGAPTDRRVVETLAPARDILSELGCIVRDNMPEIADLMAAQHVARNLCALQCEAYLAPDTALCGPEFQALLRAGRDLPLDGLVAAQHVRTRAWEEIVRFFDDCDLLVWPTASGLAYPADLVFNQIAEDWRAVELTPLLELPAISVPFGKTPDGLPAGLQIIGRKGADRLVLQCAFAIQSQQEATVS